MTSNGKRVLLVDADPVRLAISSLVLQNRGYGVASHERGIDALVRLKEHRNRFDLLISSTDLTGMTWPQLVAKARALHPELPVILLAAGGRIGDEEAQGLGIAIQLGPPLSGVELTGAVEDLLVTAPSRSHALSIGG
jgi:two-component system cell cycle sensor histidine kinase/response regulator CckA